MRTVHIAAGTMAKSGHPVQNPYLGLTLNGVPRAVINPLKP